MLSCYVLQEVPLPLNSNIGCFEMKRSRERRSGKTWLNSNIGCFEILHMSPPLLRLCELNSNIGCFEIYCRQFVAVDIIG